MRGKMFYIGYVEGTKKKLHVRIKPLETTEEREFVTHLLMEMFGETKFIEFGTWYDALEMDGLIAIDTNSKPVGFALYKIKDDVLTLLTINVKPSKQRMGVGTALLDRVKQLAQQHGVKIIRVPVSNDDLVSYVFYLRNGFTLYAVDLGLCIHRHGKELKGCFDLPLRDEFYLKWEVKR